MDIKLGRKSNLPDVNDSNSVIVGLRKTIVDRINKKNFFIGETHKEPIDISIDALLDPLVFLPIWMMSTVQVLRPMALMSSSKTPIGFTVYLEKDSEASFDYRVQSFASISPLLIINPMLETLGGCYISKKNEIFLDPMIRDSYKWFRNNGFPMENTPKINIMMDVVDCEKRY